MSGPVTSVARVDDVQIFLKDPVLVTQAPGSFEISGLFVDSSHSNGHNIYKRKPTPRAPLAIHNRRFCDCKAVSAAQRYAILSSNTQ